MVTRGIALADVDGDGRTIWLTQPLQELRVFLGFNRLPG
jgi:hypothetical protein